jgi:hypothetical protein
MPVLTTNYEAPFEVEYIYFLATPGTWEDPSYPADAEIHSIYLFGEKLSPNQTEEFLKSFGEHILTEMCIQDAERKHHGKEY